MIESIKSKLPIVNTAAIWVLVVFIVAWLCLKDDNKLNNDTIKNLTVAVEKFSVASENMSNAAKEQREWAATLQESFNQRGQQRQGMYEDLYNKYDYDAQANNTSLADLYNVRVQQHQGDNSGNVRGDEDRTSKAGTVSDPTGKPKGQSH